MAGQDATKCFAKSLNNCIPKILIERTMTMKTKKGIIAHIVCSAAIGILFFAIGQILYPHIIEKWWTPFGIALYFLIFSTIMLIAMFVFNQIRKDYSYWFKNGKKDTIKKAYIRGVVCVVVIFVLAGIFEFLYELGNDVIYDTTSYVFLIDDSGSMSGNDPQCERGEAINRIMKNQTEDMPYAVYKFSDQPELIKNMGKYIETDSFEFSSDGGTDIVGSLNRITDELISKVVDGGDYPKILLLSDGESSYAGVNSLIKKCRSNNIAVSTIGFNVNSYLLSRIARKTGGIYINVNNIDDLQEQMNKAITSFLDRNLISDRFVPKNDGLYAFLRVLFLSLIGIVFSWLKYETFCSARGPKYDSLVLRVSLICTFVGSVLMEICFNVFDFPAWLIRLIFCVLWAITPGYFVKSNVYTFDPEYQFDPDTEARESEIDSEEDKDQLTKKNNDEMQRHTLKGGSSGFGEDIADQFRDHTKQGNVGFGFGDDSDFETEVSSPFNNEDNNGFGSDESSGFGV